MSLWREEMGVGFWSYFGGWKSADMTLEFMFNPERASRLVLQKSLDDKNRFRRDSLIDISLYPNTDISVKKNKTAILDEVQKR